MHQVSKITRLAVSGSASVDGDVDGPVQVRFGLDRIFWNPNAANAADQAARHVAALHRDSRGVEAAALEAIEPPMRTGGVSRYSLLTLILRELVCSYPDREGPQ